MILEYRFAREAHQRSRLGRQWSKQVPLRRPFCGRDQVATISRPTLQSRAGVREGSVVGGVFLPHCQNGEDGGERVFSCDGAVIRLSVVGVV